MSVIRKTVYGFVVLFMLTLPTINPVHAQDTDRPMFALYWSEPTYADISYIPNGDERQRLDIHLPPDVQPGELLPTLVVVHGGGFQFGDKAGMKPFAGYFTERGFAVVSVGYRLVPSHIYPAQVQDVYCALAFIHAHATPYHLDTDNIILLGESAGATLAAMPATVDDPRPFMADCPHPTPTSWARAVVAYYPALGLAVDDYPPMTVNMAMDYLGIAPEDWESVEQRFTEASPASWIDGSEPPFFIIHGAGDFVIPVAESERFLELLQNAGVEAELVVIDGAGHGFINVLRSTEGITAAEATEDFLQRLLQ